MAEQDSQEDITDGSSPEARPVSGVARHLKSTRVEVQYRHETRNLNRQERDRYSNFLWNIMKLDTGPRVTLDRLVGTEKDLHLGFAEEGKLQTHLGYYLGKSDPAELLQVLKFFTVYLMQQTRKEADPSLQQFLLFKAVDLARMIVQHSPLSVNADAEALVFNIFIALGSEYPDRFSEYMRSEESVFQTMRRLAVVPHDVQIRLKLGEQLAEQTSYIDALAQYHMLLRILVRRGEQSSRSRGYVLSRIGDLFQDLSKVTLRHLGDGRKLKNFVDRFNLDFADRGRQIPPFNSATSAQVRRVRTALLREGVNWQLRAAATPTLELRVRLNSALQAGSSLITLGDHARALKELEDGYELWRGIPESAASLQDKSEYLKEYTSAAVHLKRRSKLEWVTREISDVSEKQANIERKEKERQQAKAVLLA